MTYTFYRNKCEKQIREYIEFVSFTTGPSSLKLLDEITRLRFVVNKIDRMTESEAYEKVQTTTLIFESGINDPDNL